MIHPTALVDPTAVLGPGTHVWQYAHVRMGVRMGANGSVGGGAEIGTYSTLGENVRIGYGVFIPSRTRIGSHVFIGPRAVLCDDKYPIANNPRYRAQPPLVEDGVSIGAGAVILPGVRLGTGAQIGAGAVVTHDVEPYTVVAGNPARPLPVPVEAS